MERFRSQPTGPPLFSPTNTSSPLNPTRSWSRHIWASQFPRDCNSPYTRYLLFEDDLGNQGAGYSLNLYAYTLLMAMADHRVLLEVPVEPGWMPYGAGNTSAFIWNTSRHYSHVGHHKPARRPRWCSRAPHTLQCFYQPWSHCPLPEKREHTAPVLHTRWQYVIMGWPDRRTRAVRVKLSWIYCSWFLWMGKFSRALDAAIRFLLRPRDWIRRQSECVLGQSQRSTSSSTNSIMQHQTRRRPVTRAEDRQFVSVFLRKSAEKDAELKAHGHSSPPIAAFHDLAAIAIRALVPSEMKMHAARAGSPRSRAQPRVLVVHTSSAVCLANLTALTKASGSFDHIASTANPRSEHDEFGGWRADRSIGGGGEVDETLQGTIGAVNADLASRAALLLTPKFSAWSTMLKALLSADVDALDGETPPPPQPPSHTAGGQRAVDADGTRAATVAGSPPAADAVNPEHAAGAWVVSFCCGCSPRESRLKTGNIDAMIAGGVEPSVRARLQQALLGARVHGCSEALPR